jgi:hypothetical protein
VLTAHEPSLRRLPPGPFLQPFQDPCRPGADRLAQAEAVQIVGQIHGAAIATGWFLLEAFQADRFQVARQTRLESARRHRLLSAYLLQGLQDACGPEGRPTREGFVKDCPQCIDIDGRADPVAVPAGLLRGHVARRAQDGAAFRPTSGNRRPRILVQLLGQAKVADLGRAVLRQQDVRWLEVPVDEASLVGGLDRSG